MNSILLPDWAVASPSRRAHIARVVALLDRWAEEMRLDSATAAEWHDAGVFHDALRDASEAQLRAIVPALAEPFYLLHGPAAARLLEMNGESRLGMLAAIRDHTLGSPHWGTTGRALYCADFLEPGRTFDAVAREALSSSFPTAPESVFRDVVRLRISHALENRHPIHPRTAETWNSTI